MELDRAGIAACLPHAGRMCLLDRVLHWDEHGIRCAAVSHRDAGNPLRDAAGLATLAGIEYAAQAAAVHGALLHGARLNGARLNGAHLKGARLNGNAAPRSGVLAALKNVTATRPWLHDVAEDLVVEATLLHSDPAGGVFAFAVFAGITRVLSGQFTLMYIDPVDANHDLPEHPA